jgi:hypothetical protein
MVGARGEHSGNWAVIVEDKGHRTKFKYELRLGAPTSRVAQIRMLLCGFHFLSRCGRTQENWTRLDNQGFSGFQLLAIPQFWQGIPARLSSFSSTDPSDKSVMHCFPTQFVCWPCDNRAVLHKD